MGSCPFPPPRQSGEAGLSRRGFLKASAAAVAAAVLSSLVLPHGISLAASSQPWLEHPFEGEHWENCHRVRDNLAFPQAATDGGVVDIVVVGGGVSGMTATFKLRDLNVVLLDKGTTIGGNARKGTWSGVDYPLGAMYIDKPEGYVKALLEESGITPTRIPRPADSLFVDGHVTADLFGEGWKDLPYSKDVRQAWKEVCERFSAYNSDSNAPQLPIEQATKKALELDHLTFHDYLLDHRIHPEVMALLDDYIRSDFGAGNRVVSAYAAINFLMGEFEATYGFPGGNGGFTSAMATKIAAHTRSNCFVNKVETVGRYSRVHYLQDGIPKSLRCRAVVMATSQNIAAKVLEDASEARLTAAVGLRYGAYMMGVIYLKAPICDYGFDVWSRGRFYTDLCVADWIATGGRPRPQRQTVLVASIPMGQNQGRETILKATHQELEDRLLSDLEKDHKGSREKVLGTQFARYGHPMILPIPGFMQNTAPILRRHEGNVFFAHSDLQGLPCFEAATWTGIRAAEDARAAVFSSKKVSHPIKKP